MSIYINEGDFWESAKVKQIFGIENHMLCMCRVEAAIANADAEMGLISQRDADKINAMVDSANVDLALYNEQLGKTGGHPVVSFITAWKQSFGDDPAKDAIHFAAATPDIIDNVKLLKLRDVHAVILDDLFQLREILKNMAHTYRDTLVVGRTHHQHAVPMTFGYKVATWLMELQRQIVRLENSAKQLFVVSCYGAVGSSNTFGKRGMEFNRLVAKYLEMDWSPVCWQTSRDTEIEYLSCLASIAGTMGHIGTELYELSSTEIGEIAEPWTYGNMGSSTMPHKRNPWGIEMMIALSRTCLSQMTNEFNCMTQFHERDFMVQYQENFSIPAICNTCEHTLQYGIRILDGLEIYPERMRANMDITNGAIMLENVMMHLTKKMSRFTAHKKLYDYAMQSYRDHVAVKDLVLADPEIMSIITPEELEQAFDYAAYVGNCPEQVDAALALCE